MKTKLEQVGKGTKWLLSLLAIALLSYSPLRAQQRILTLDSCRQMALRQNNLLKAEDYKIKQAEAKRKEVDINFFPKVSMQGAFLHIDKPIKIVDWDYLLGPMNVLVPASVRSLTTLHADNVWVGNLSMVQPLFMGGKIVAGHNMAAKAVKLAETMAETKQTEVAMSVEDTYWQVVCLKSKETLLKQLVKMLEDAVKNVDMVIKEGVGTKADGLTIRVKLSEAEQTLLKVQNGLYLSRMLLAQQCGLGLDANFEVADEIGLNEKSTTEIATPKVYSIDTTLLKQKSELRSEIRSLRLADTIFKHKERMEMATALPKLAVVGAYTVSNPTPLSMPRERFDGTWAVSLVMQIPITDIATGIEKRNQAHAERMIKQFELKDAQTKIGLQMRQAILNNSEANKQLAAAKLNMERAEENLRYAQLGYKEGVIPLLNLTMAQTAWSQAHDTFIDAVIAVKLSESKIKHIIPQA